MSSLLQAVQHDGQAHVALLEVGHSGHDLLVSGMAACLLQLAGQIGQFTGVGGVVAHHVLHQSQQLVHGGVLAVGAAAVAVTAAVMVMMVVMMVMAVVMIVVMMMLVAVIVQVVMGVGMLVIMAVGVVMIVGVGVAVMGVLVGMGMSMLMIVAAAAEMIFVNMHGKFSFNQ